MNLLNTRVLMKMLVVTRTLQGKIKKGENQVFWENKNQHVQSMTILH